MGLQKGTEQTISLALMDLTSERKLTNAKPNNYRARQVITGILKKTEEGREGGKDRE